MAQYPTGVRARPVTATQPRVLLFDDPGVNRRLVKLLEGTYNVETTTDPDALSDGVDLCLVSGPRVDSLGERIQRHRSQETDFPPVLVVVGTVEDADPAVWDVGDEVIERPVHERTLRTRVQNLVERHQTAARLRDRDAMLERAIEELALKEQAIDEAPVGFSIADATQPDAPLVYVNDQFLTLTGYEQGEVIGQNCRFLQGAETDPDTVATMRAAIDDERPVSVDVRNYRKSGEKFWNRVHIAPLRNTSGVVTHFVGFQIDITDRKVRERRQEVLNRVLSHNLRNKMNVIDAHVEMVESTLADPPEELDSIREAARNLERLAETARTTDRLLSQADTGETLGDLTMRLRQLVDSVRDRYPAVTIDLDLPDEELPPVAAGGLLAALEEAIDNAAKHNDSADPNVELRVRNRTDGWVDVAVEDNGPGIPAQEIDVLTEGEQALHHADRMGIWLIYWTVTRAGGTMDVTDLPDGGTRISLSAPVAE